MAREVRRGCGVAGGNQLITTISKFEGIRFSQEEIMKNLSAVAVLVLYVSLFLPTTGYTQVVPEGLSAESVEITDQGQCTTGRRHYCAKARDASRQRYKDI
jgi:hypothetical protein